ncbi:MAG: hypothetical protein R2855_04900 [Thermomicrobiales bacterium]
MGMGRRHLAGLAELERCVGHVVELVAVCDLNDANANDLADEADQLLGYRPLVFTGIEAMAAGADGLEAADCTTDSGSHHVNGNRVCSVPVGTRWSRNRWR